MERDFGGQTHRRAAVLVWLRGNSYGPGEVVQ